MKRTKKVLAGVSAILMTTTTVGCGSPSSTSEIISTEKVTTTTVEETPTVAQNPVTQQPPKENVQTSEVEIDDDIETFAKDNGIDLPEIPNDEYCSEWEFDMEAGVWKCNDSESTHYSYLYYGGLYYATLSYLMNNKTYKDYHTSKGFAGGNKLQSKFSNGITRSSNNGTYSNSNNGNNTGKSGFGS
ncbi:hypothetical protein [Priestia taiwanensis]|uniref:Uncharacterized protein n=1 Tax=Priestia taiwanensis TaxID=1347902 RepID=A0A917AR18_9BACI|nr:hypothetical protein [Priestia taiwanensis]MBM7362653.1 hypothetical protein [Priestia taiwanensis]GGE63966.1 hypothetical protein GCM10007140_12790 [Priestia taiwanensis]